MNKQSFITILLTVLMSMAGARACAHDIEAANNDGVTIYYKWINNNTELTVSYRGDDPNEYRYEYSGNIVIPKSVVYQGNTYSVTSIDERAFENCMGLTSVTIPNSVTSISYAAFYGCGGLTTVTIPSSVISIGGYAFYHCSGLTSVTIPNSAISIGSSAFEGTAWYNNLPDGLVYAGKVAYKYKGEMPENTSIIIEDGTLEIAGSAFRDCSGLTSVTIPNSVTSIGYGAFFGCGLTSVTIPNSVTSIGDAVFYNCSGLTSVTIPNSVTSIGSRAFQGCSGLTSVTIPSSVTSISEGAFWECSGLTSVTIPSSVISIGDAAFEGTAWYNNLPDGLVYAGKVAYKYKGEMPKNTSIIIEDGTVEIVDYAFQKCSGLTSVTIPNSVTSIGSSAFDGCSGLTSVTIPNSVTSISGGAFSGCTGLTSVTIPSSVTSIGSRAFYGCSSLTSVTIPSSMESIGDYAFVDCSGLTSVTIPSSVTSIGEYAFMNCSGLTSVTIPSSVTSISGGAFSGCTGLTSVTIPSSVTSIGSRAFEDCTSIQLVKSFIFEPYSIHKSVFPAEVYRQSPLYIPAGTETLYTRFDGWKEFLKIEVMEGLEEQEIPGAEKCATPTISFENDKLSFSCQTEGVDYKYTIEANDAKRGYGNYVQMPRTYKVTVIAFKEGMNSSDPAIIFLGKKGDVDGNGVVNVADHVELSKIILGQDNR